FYNITSVFWGKKAAIGIPTFSEYEDACKKSALKIRYYDRSEVTNISFNEDLVFLCNPNNPNGFSNSVLEIEKMVKNFPNTMF
ncbi:hypothetical protein J9332_43880, partial [Aquimarina celericrescens]|nr:hypothetical protein [Aquimarina celericrescens]